MLKRILVIACLLGGVSSVSLNAMRQRPDFLDPTKPYKPGERESALCLDIFKNTLGSEETDAQREAQSFVGYRAALKIWLNGCTLDMDLKCRDSDALSAKEYVRSKMNSCDEQIKQHRQLRMSSLAAIFERRKQQLGEILKILEAYRLPPADPRSLGGASGGVVVAPSPSGGSVPTIIEVQMFTDPSLHISEGRIEIDICEVIYDNVVASPYEDESLSTREFNWFLGRLNKHLERCAEDGRLDLDMAVDFKVGGQRLQLSPRAYLKKLYEETEADLFIDDEPNQRVLGQLRQVQEALSNYRPRSAIEADSIGLSTRSSRFKTIFGLAAIPVAVFAIWKLFIQKTD